MKRIQMSRRPRVFKAVGYLRGKSNKAVDKVRIAMKPGWRISKRGNRYFEARRNRADLKRH